MKLAGLILLATARAAVACLTGTEPVLTTIPEVQGRGAASPCPGRIVTVTGVVTGAFAHLSGFFLQDSSGDGDPATSDGLFVFAGTAAGLPQAGASVRATGRVVEFSRSGRTGSVTELDVRASASPLARMETLGAGALPRAIGLDPPPGADEYMEAREGMLVEYPDSVVIHPSNEFGEFFVLRWDRLPIEIRPTPGDPGAGRPVMVDRSFRQVVKIFDLAPALRGPLHFDFGNYRLEPAAPYEISDAGMWPLPAAEAAAGDVTVASLNAQRLVRVDLPGANLNRKLDRLATSIRERLRSPEILAVQEVEDQDLLAELGRRAGGYEAVLLKGCDFSGINVGILYRPERVRVVSTAQLQTEAPEFRKGRCTLPGGREFQQILFDRPPLRADLTVDGTPLTVVVNHWRSQIGGRDEQRLASAAFVASELRNAGIANLVVLGDFNDTEDSEPLLRLSESAGLTNVSLFAPAGQRYSLLFEGISQAFDHVLLSPSLAARRTGSGFVHQHADFPPERAADHDNPYVRLRLSR